MLCKINDSCNYIDVYRALGAFLTCRDYYSRMSRSKGFFTNILIFEEEHFFKPSPSMFSLWIFCPTLTFSVSGAQNYNLSPRETSLRGCYFDEGASLSLRVSFRLFWWLRMSSTLRLIEISFALSE